MKRMLFLILIAVGAVAAATGSAAARDYNCSDFATQGEARYLEPGAPYGLDADGDDLACGSLSAGGGDGGSTGGGSPKSSLPPSAPKLNMSAAKRAAEAKAKHFASRNGDMGRPKFMRCARRSKHRVDCGFTAEGHTSDSETTCRITVYVEGAGHSASARVRPICRTYPLLTAARAKPALRAAATRLAGKPAELQGIFRQSRLYFVANAYWQTSISRAEWDECSAELIARLTSSGRIVVRARDVECTRR
jgi:hypothetical protein